MKPEEEREIGYANGWRYVIRCSAEGELFSVLRESMKLSDHGHCLEFIRGCYSEKEARKVTSWHMNRCADGTEPAPIARTLFPERIVPQFLRIAGAPIVNNRCKVTYGK